MERVRGRLEGAGPGIGIRETVPELLGSGRGRMARGTGRAVRSEGAAQSRSCADDVALRRWQTVFDAEATSGAGMRPYSAGVRLEVAAECYRRGPRAGGRVGGTLRSGGSRGLRILLCPRRAVAGCCEYALGRRPGESCGCSDGARDLRPGCCGGEIMVQKTPRTAAYR